MAAPANTPEPSVKIRQTLSSNKLQLLAAWKEVECSDFEPCTKGDLQVELIAHYCSR